MNISITIDGESTDFKETAETGPAAKKQKLHRNPNIVERRRALRRLRAAAANAVIVELISAELAIWFLDGINDEVSE
jgi:hypothetical protein